VASLLCSYCRPYQHEGWTNVTLAGRIFLHGSPSLELLRDWWFHASGRSVSSPGVGADRELTLTQTFSWCVGEFARLSYNIVQGWSIVRSLRFQASIRKVGVKCRDEHNQPTNDNLHLHSLLPPLGREIMAILSTVLNLTGLVFLAHAYALSRKCSPNSSHQTNSSSSVYSSYEHSLTITNPEHSLPLDIIIETIVSVSLLCVGIVLASPPLRPIQWSVWAEQIEKDERRPKGKRQFEDEGVAPINPFRWLEERKGFWDVKGKRKEFADWVRNGAGKQS